MGALPTVFSERPKYIIASHNYQIIFLYFFLFFFVNILSFHVFVRLLGTV